MIKMGTMSSRSVSNVCRQIKLVLLFLLSVVRLLAFQCILMVAVLYRLGYLSISVPGILDIFGCIIDSPYVSSLTESSGILY